MCFEDDELEVWEWAYDFGQEKDDHQERLDDFDRYEQELGQSQDEEDLDEIYPVYEDDDFVDDEEDLNDIYFDDDT